MAYRILLSARAEADIERMLNWFRTQHATQAGQRWFSTVESKILSLSQNPERCSLAIESEDLGLEIRELLVGRGRYRHRLLFRITDRTIHILRLWHSSRDSIKPEDVDT